MGWTTPTISQNSPRRSRKSCSTRACTCALLRRYLMRLRGTGAHGHDDPRLPPNRAPDRAGELRIAPPGSPTLLRKLGLSSVRHRSIEGVANLCRERAEPALERRVGESHDSSSDLRARRRRGSSLVCGNIGDLSPGRGPGAERLLAWFRALEPRRRGIVLDDSCFRVPGLTL